jgi:hypothetical protein
MYELLFNSHKYIFVSIYDVGRVMINARYLGYL